MPTMVVKNIVYRGQKEGWCPAVKMELVKPAAAGRRWVMIVDFIIYGFLEQEGWK
jgi:hypothetical protein